MRILFLTMIVLGGCAERVAEFKNVDYQLSDGTTGFGSGSSRIRKAEDVLPLTLTFTLEVLIQEKEMPSSVPSRVDAFTLATAPGSPCSVKTPGSCVGNVCSGAIDINQYGICLVGMNMKTPEADGIQCWGYSIIDGPSIGDAAYNMVYDMAEEACLNQF